MENLTDLNPQAAALLLLDIQNFSVNATSVPISGKQIAANAGRLAEACRRSGVLVIRVRVGTFPELRLTPPADASMNIPAFDFSSGCYDFPEELGSSDTDIIVTKHNWGAFYGTDLDVHLRRRGICTLIECGIATNYAVEGTVRQAHERAYSQIIVSDAVGAFSVEEHEYPFRVIFPHIARIRSTDELIDALLREK